ncbi:MFS transporter, partial [Curtobacterium sp. B18]|uniref:MFS transporter n=1 Tax=Curtobacterium sp. B18 TaxID=95614 RepID=UPI0003B69DD5
MRARVVAGGVVSSVAVLVIGWQLGGQPAVTAPAQQSTTAGTGTSGSATTGGASGRSSTGTGTSGSGTSGSGTSGTSGSGTSGTGTSGGSSASGTFAGDTTQTQYGPVQVQITVANGKITDVTTALLTDVFPESILSLGLGLNATVAAVGQVIGPVVGGLVAESNGWRWIFLGGIPISLAGL